MGKPVNEIVITIGAIIWYSLITVNVNPTLGLIYAGLFSSLSLFLYLFDRSRTVPIERRTDNRLQALMIGLAAYVGLIALAQVIVQISEFIPISNLIKLLAASTPALADSVFFNILTFSVFIAYTETQTLFVRLFDFLASRFNIQVDRKNIFNFKLWLVILGISFIFMLLHVTAKGITNNVALLTVFIMAVISMVMVVWFREGKQAILFHIAANTIAMLFTYGIL